MPAMIRADNKAKKVKLKLVGPNFPKEPKKPEWQQRMDQRVFFEDTQRIR